MTPERGNVSSIERIQHIIREWEETQAQYTPVQPDTVQQESLASQTTLLNTRDPDGISMTGEVVGMVRDLKLSPHPLNALGISLIVEQDNNGSLKGSGVPHLQTADKNIG